MITRNSPIVGECCSGAGTTTSVVAQRSETGDMKDRGGKNTSRARQDSESDTRCNSFGGYDEFLFPNGSFGELGEFHIAMLEEQWGRDEVHLSLDPVEVDTLMMSAIKDEVKEMNVGESKAPVQCVTKPRARPAKAAQMKQNTRLKNEKVEDPQKRLAKARQKRYRENVKSKMKTVEEKVVKGESEIQSLREENARLKAVNANLERNMDDRRLCKEAFLRHAAGTKVIQVMNTTDGIKYETIENGGKAVEVLEEISNLSQEVPPSDLIEDFAVKIALDPAMHTKEKTVITLQKKLRILLDAVRIVWSVFNCPFVCCVAYALFIWLRCPLFMQYHNVSLDKSLIERKIVNIFTIRRHVASAILIFRPELVIEKLSDGWVGEDFADFGSVQLDTNAIELLVVRRAGTYLLFLICFCITDYSSFM